MLVKIMKWISCTVLGSALVVGLAFGKQASGADDDVAGIAAQCKAFKAGWNSHDPKAMAAVFADDADAIDPMGHVAATRAAIEKAFAADHTGKGAMRDSTIEVTDEPVRFVTPDVAISDAEAILTGAYGPDGSKLGPLGVHVTNIWRKSNGTWSLFASRPHLKMAPPPEK
jgi:uncharacterized protein (TIGR02246 family)